MRTIRPADAAEQTHRLQEMTEEERRSFVPQPLRSVLQIKEGETVYDACWYPHMNSQRTFLPLLRSITSWPLTSPHFSPQSQARVVS